MTLKKYVPAAMMLMTLTALAAPLMAAGAASREAFQAEEAQLRKVINTAVDAYVFIGGGSGAVITADGYVITNNHVAGRTRNWRIRNAAGKVFRAEVVGVAPTTDLALLKIKSAKNLPHLPLGDSDKLAPGDTVIAVGNPFALGNLDHTPTVTLGVVSAIGINRPHAGDAVVTDTPINPGNSGGPLVNMKGELIGVNGQVSTRFGIRANTGSGYAVSSNQVKRYFEALKADIGGPVQPGVIEGVRMNVDRFDVAKIIEVTEGCPAEKAGLKADDVILAVADWPVATVHELIAVAARFPDNATVPLTVQRSGTQRPIDLKLERNRPTLGVIFDRKSRDSLKVHTIVPGGPADKAGIRPGDVLVRLGRFPLPNRQVYQQRMMGARIGQRVALTVRRNGKTVQSNARADGIWQVSALLRKSRRRPRPKTRPTTRPATRPAS